MKRALMLTVVCIACVAGCSTKNEIKASNGTDVDIAFVFRGTSYVVPSGAMGVELAGDQDIPNGTFAYGSVLYTTGSRLSAYSLGAGASGSLNFIRNQTSYSVSYGYGDTSDSLKTVVCGLSSNDPVSAGSTAP